jgi:hypothetical protein
MQITAVIDLLESDQAPVTVTLARRRSENGEPRTAIGQRLRARAKVVTAPSGRTVPKAAGRKLAMLKTVLEGLAVLAYFAVPALAGALFLALLFPGTLHSLRGNDSGELLWLVGLIVVAVAFRACSLAWRAIRLAAFWVIRTRWRLRTPSPGHDWQLPIAR